MLMDEGFIDYVHLRDLTGHHLDPSFSRLVKLGLTTRAKMIAHIPCCDLLVTTVVGAFNLAIRTGDEVILGWELLVERNERIQGKEGRLTFIS